MNTFSGTRFAGDGRRLLPPSVQVAGTFSASIRRSAARRIIEFMIVNGRSVHSGMGATLWVPMEYCNYKKWNYVITGNSENGFYFELK